MDTKVVPKISEKICEKFANIINKKPQKKGKEYKIGVDLGTANVVVAVLNENNEPVAGAMKSAQVVKDGVVVDFVGAKEIVKRMVDFLNEELEGKLRVAACAIPSGTGEGVSKATKYVVEEAGLEVIKVVDEPTAAAKLLEIMDGIVVDIGGGTTGISVLKDGKVVYVADEPTGGTHFTLVLAGHFNISFEEAEKIKLDVQRQKLLTPILKPCMEKVAEIIKRHTFSFDNIDTIYLVGGASALHGLKEVVENTTRKKVIVPQYPIFITPLGIALSCEKG
ncbi:ethanolamine utilization protein EutJ [Thermoanaerobacter sp. A7A]|uniref:ethanolamine utilization protein EutJ n=1 Tax=Thermoanaerobacter sp. A7A TaxID=1350366 RepID=UPI00041AA2A5|nr:ethanolamine utilization protein EutJ [Thermoanaerobacter sp. A7A]